jgi:hypothetical protein
VLPGFAAGADVMTQQLVVRMLANSRLFPEAAGLASRWKLEHDSAIQDIILYSRYIDNVSRGLDKEYRRMALGKTYQERMRRQVESQSEKLWKALHWSTRPERFSTEQFAKELQLRFGVLIRPEYPSFFSFGHRVLETEQPVEQYKRKTVMHLIVLDSMVSNGFISWLLDIPTAIGGWGTPPDAIVQVRNDSSTEVWKTVTDPETMRRIGALLEQWNQSDGERARTNSYGFLPGLRARLALAGYEKLLRRLKQQGLNGTELRSTFLNEYERLFNAGSIFAHEGRHVFDLTENPDGWANEDLEFRAKLSEVAFAPEPLLVLGAIFNENIGQAENSHGLANERIMKGLVAWMQAHASEITSLDPSRPLLPQFDRLTEDQMREAFRSMDPWTKGH